MYHPFTPRRLASLTALVLGALTLWAGTAAAQPPGYGEGGPAVSLSASASADSITATGTGFEAGEPVTATVFSDPVILGTKDADGAGSVIFTFSVQNLAPGEHRIVLEAPSGSASAVFTVLAAATNGGAPSAQVGNGGSGSGGELAFTGSDLIVPLGVVGLVLLLGGGAAAVVGSRRRDRSTSGR